MSKLRLLSIVIGIQLLLSATAAEIVESRRKIPVIHEVDVVVVGGSTGAVAAAVQASKAGARVYLVAPRPYLGEDMAGTFRLWKGNSPATGLARELLESRRLDLTPLNIKKFLDEALLKANVSFMTGCYATDALRTSDREIAGIVISNRSGRQAIKAKVVIDASPRGMIARQIGADFAPFKPGTYSFSKVVMSGKQPQADGMTVKSHAKSYTVQIGGRWGVKPANGAARNVNAKMYECIMPVKLKSNEPLDMAEAEQLVRDKIFNSDQQDVAEFSFYIPSDHVIGRQSAKSWKDAASFPLAATQAKGKKYLYILGAMSDVNRKALPTFLEPPNLMAVGERLGAAAAEEAKSRPALTSVRVAAKRSKKGKSGSVRELLDGLLSNSTTATGAVRHNGARIPVLAQCDVVVAGGGTSGGPATIAAARQGMKTIVCEFHHDLGGVSTVGVLGQYFFGNHCGFTAEMDEPIKKIASNINQGKAEWYRRECRRLGVQIFLGTMVTGAIVKSGKVSGVIVAMPDGTRGAILAEAVIDATGNADVAAAAREETEFLTEKELSVQGATMNHRPLGSNTVNIDIGFVDDTDAWDMSFFPLRTRSTLGYNMFWDQSQHVCSRERRHLVGAHKISPIDALNQRAYPDTITQCKAPFDTHGQTSHRLLYLYNASIKVRHVRANIPYRAILPKKVDGLLVIGLGMSTHRDALPVIRMQRDLHNLGYASGIAAAMSVKGRTKLRSISIKSLQNHLIKVGVLRPDVLHYKDGFSVNDAELKKAVDDLPKLGWKDLHGYTDLYKLCTAPEKSKELLKKAYGSATEPQAKAMYAAALALFGDKSGTKTLIEAVKNSQWDRGWNWEGMGAFGRKISYVDGYIIMLAELDAKGAVPAILQKAEQLTITSQYSHYRAVALACEALGDRSAAPVLAKVLDKHGIRGHHLELKPGQQVPRYRGHSNRSGDRERNACLRELCIARALYNLGDHQGKGKAILEAYAKDPRTAYAKHAQLVLRKKLGRKTARSRGIR